MEDALKILESLKDGTPVAILVVVVGVVWQIAYAIIRDRIQNRQAQRELMLQQRKFEQQGKLEEQKFAYEQRRWREQLGHDLTVKLVDARLEEYSRIWSCVESVARHQQKTLALSEQAALDLAEKIKSWRY